MHFPNQTDIEVHGIASGAGILKNAPNPDNANRFLEFLLSKRVQNTVADLFLFEYPIVEGVLPSPEIASFGLNFKEDDTAVKRFGELQIQMQLDLWTDQVEIII